MDARLRRERREFTASRSEARPCAAAIISRMGEQAFRRPLSEDDRTGLMSFYDEAAANGDFELEFGRSSSTTVRQDRVIRFSAAEPPQ